uniref:Si:ch211-14i3.2 n=1 Tax=Labrus bergylta TaxID=56723 RepID=A0A3Q3G134_9LABR|nr:uncharacterized protein LOC109990288 [Labrus bergylta]
MLFYRSLDFSTKMGLSSLLYITLTLPLASLGSFIQTANLPDKSDNSQKYGIPGGYINDPFILASKDILHSESIGDSLEGSGLTGDGTALKLISHINPEEHNQVGNENPSGPEITLTKTQDLTLLHSEAGDPGEDKANTHSSVHIISEGALIEDSLSAAEEQLEKIQSSKVDEDLLDPWKSPKLPVQNNKFTALTKQDLSGPGVSCVHGPCVVFTNFNGTNLLWEDMRRTLAFAWELHVFGSASLFILIAVLAIIGTAGACTRPRPFCDALIQANMLLILSGTLRGVLLLLDPYGTRQVLSRATLAALHNVPLQLLLWAQVILALVALRGLNLMLFPLKLQRPWVVGVLAISICTSLLVADLFSQTLSPALPLLLQTLSLCWGLPFCIVILIKSFSHLHPFLRSSVPQWVPSQRIERRAKRVAAVSAFLGVLCCSLQMHSLFWLYGLLGNWRRFGWGWWLSQFSARILEVSWGFSLLVLGSWTFWTPSMVQSRGDPGQSRSETSKNLDGKSLWGSLLARIQKGSLTKSEKTWEDLMPSNWAMYNLTRTGFNNSAMCPYDDQPSTITPEYKTDPRCNNSSSDSQAAILWQKKVSERDCILSLIEFDIGPPSPINLRHNVNNAVHHEQLVAGGLFIAPISSWTVGRGIPGRDGGATTFPTGDVRYCWTMDMESEEPLQSPCAVYCDGDVWSQATAYWTEESNSAGMYPQDWSDDDVTDL